MELRTLRIACKLLLAASAVVACFAGLEASSQSIPALPSGIDPALIQRGMEQLTRDNRRQTLQPNLESRQTVEQPSMLPSERPAAPPSLLEEEYSRRANRPLLQIGYEVFGVGQPVFTREVGAVQDTYVLGVGDELLIHLRGKVNQSVVVPIDREGTVVLPELPPIPAAGLPFGDFRRQIRNEVQQRMLGTDIFASVSRIREITVTLAGQLQNPGVVRISGLNTVIDAIHLAGGIKKTGSLRNIQILRQGESITVDLYDVVAGRSAAPLPSLAEGDRLFIPVVGTTLAVAGQVKRPGIYELAPTRTEIDASELLRLGGGELIRGEYRHSVLRIRQDGTQEFVELARVPGRLVHGGEVLVIEPASGATSGRVTMLGHVRLPGTQALAGARSVRALLGGYGALLPDPYLPFAVVEQTDSRSRATSFRQVDLRAVLDRRTDQSLSSDDRLYVFGLKDIRFLTSFDVVEALAGRVTVDARNCAGVQFLARWVRSNPRSELASGQFNSAVRDLAGGPQPCPSLFNEVPGLLTFLVQNAILVRGNVLNPGVYPIATRESVDEVMGIARSLNGDRRGDASPAVEGADAIKVVSEDLGRALDVLPDGDAPITRMSQSSGAVPTANPWAASRPAAPGGASAFPTWTILDVEEPRVSLTGHVRYPGTRNLSSAPTLRELIGDPGVYEDDPYLLFGIIFRSDPVTLLRQALPFAPAKVISGETNLRLQARDVVRIFGFAEVRTLLSGAASADGAAVNQGDNAARNSLHRLLNESALEILGQFVSPGRYPVAGTITLEQAFTTAGGTLPGADLSQVELTRFPLNNQTARHETHRTLLDLRRVSPRAVSVTVGDTVFLGASISQREQGLVEISGEVRRPGRYGIVRGEKLSSFIARAGGLQPTAYPAGAVFTRESVRRAETAAAARTAREFHRAILGRMAEPPRATGPQMAFTGQQAEIVMNLLQRISATEVVGRMVVEVNPIILKQQPELDTILEGGDRIVIPRIPSTVFVSGEVYNPGAQRFALGRSVSDYIEAAGGLTNDAESSTIFVIRPDGSATRVNLSAWGRESEQAAPGSWIVVPRDLAPFRFWDVAGGVTQILSSLAVSAASLAVISQNN